MKIPQILNNFNCYDGSNKSEKLVGVTAEVTLPEIEFLSETLSGVGINGEIDAVAIGHTGAMEQEVPFNNLEDDIFSFMSPKKGVHLILRGSQQIKNTSTGEIINAPMRVVLKGQFKKFTAGSAGIGKAGNPSVTFTLEYILIELNKKKKFELDKLNGVYKVNNTNMLSDIKSQC